MEVIGNPVNAANSLSKLSRQNDVDACTHVPSEASESSAAQLMLPIKKFEAPHSPLPHEASESSAAQLVVLNKFEAPSSAAQLEKLKKGRGTIVGCTAGGAEEARGLAPARRTGAAKRPTDVSIQHFQQVSLCFKGVLASQTIFEVRFSKSDCIYTPVDGGH